MLKREWLASQGLAIAGARGRLSRGALRSVEKAERDFKQHGVPLPWDNVSEIDKVEPSERVDKKVYASIPDGPVRRAESVAWTVDNGVVIALQFCGGCAKTIKRCSHEIPLVPAFLGGGEAMLVKPNV